MLKTILPAIPAIIVVFLVIAAWQPSDSRVTRATTSAAAPEIVFLQVNDLRQWEAWSPWAKLDPHARSTFDGPPAGAGRAMTWAGNNTIGEGCMTITESRPGESIRFNLEFPRPFKASNVAEFSFKAAGNQTAVIRSMSGKNNFRRKAFGLVVNCDKLVGGDFEQGLAH